MAASVPTPWWSQVAYSNRIPAAPSGPVGARVARTHRERGIRRPGADRLDVRPDAPKMPARAESLFGELGDRGAPFPREKLVCRALAAGPAGSGYGTRSAAKGPDR